MPLKQKSVSVANNNFRGMKKRSIYGTIIELKKAHPEVKLIAMSGGGWYGTDIDFDMAKKLGARTLDKPFALQELLDVVGELLD